MDGMEGILQQVSTWTFIRDEVTCPDRREAALLTVCGRHALFRVYHPVDKPDILLEFIVLDGTKYQGVVPLPDEPNRETFYNMVRAQEPEARTVLGQRQQLVSWEQVANSFTEKFVGGERFTRRERFSFTGDEVRVTVYALPEPEWVRERQLNAANEAESMRIVHTNPPLRGHSRHSRITYSGSFLPHKHIHGPLARDKCGMCNERIIDTENRLLIGLQSCDHLFHQKCILPRLYWEGVDVKRSLCPACHNDIFYP